MEQKFGINSLNLQVLREFCEHEGKMVEYRKGDQLEREGDPARWFAFVTEGCFKYVKYGMSDDKAHITWFSFKGEFVSTTPHFSMTVRHRLQLKLWCPAAYWGLRASNWNYSSIKTWKRWNYEPWLASTFSANSVRVILTSIVLRPVNATRCCCNAVQVSWSFLTYKTSPRSWTSIQILSAKYGVTLHMATNNSL